MERTDTVFSLIPATTLRIHNEMRSLLFVLCSVLSKKGSTSKCSSYWEYYYNQLWAHKMYFIFTWGHQNSKWNDAIYKTIVDKKIKNNIRRFKTRDSFLFIIWCKTQFMIHLPYYDISTILNKRGNSLLE